MPHSPTTTDHPVTIVEVPVVSVATVDPRDAAMSMRKLVTIVGRLLWTAELSLGLDTDGAGGVSAHWLLRAADQIDAHTCADDLRALLDAVVPWMGLGPAALAAPARNETLRATHHFRPGPMEMTTVVNRVSPPWRFARGDSRAWRLEVTLGGPAILDESDVTSAPWVRARVTLFGAGPRADLMANLLAEDTLGGQTLCAEPARTDHWRAFGDFSTDLIGHLLAGPARMPGAFPVSPPLGLDGLTRTLAAAASPHLLLLGGTGQGKSTLLAHLADRSLAERHQLICADVHDGEFAARVHDRARQHGLDPLVLDLGEHPAGQCHGLSVTVPPPRADAGRWADDLFGIIRDVLWERMPEEFFGPVGRRATTLCLTALIRDPSGPQPLTRLPDLVDATSSAFRDGLLARIDDPTLTRAFRSEVMPMLTSKDPGNSAIWLTSKLDPLIGAGPVSRIVESARSIALLDDAITSGRSIIVLAPSADLGDGGSRVLVSVLLHRAWLLLRAHGEARPVHLLLDEWHRFPVPTIGSMLAEGRKFGLSLRLANQNLNQLPAALAQTVLANSGAIATFRSAPADARELDLLFPRITRFQLQTLPAHHLAVTAGDRDLIVRAPEPLVIDGPPVIARQFRRIPRLRQPSTEGPARPVGDGNVTDDAHLDDWLAARRR